eukprot:8708923-Pyramimonas_sp.AAC.1
MAAKCVTLNTYDWIVQNVTPYDGDESFLAGPTEKTAKLWDKCKELLAQEMKQGGVLDIEDKKPSTLTSHSKGLIDEQLDDVIVGLQGEAPLQRTMKPLGGYRLVKVSEGELGEMRCSQNMQVMQSAVVPLLFAKGIVSIKKMSRNIGQGACVMLPMRKLVGMQLEN